MKESRYEKDLFGNIVNIFNIKEQEYITVLEFIEVFKYDISTKSLSNRLQLYANKYIENINLPEIEKRANVINLNNLKYIMDHEYIKLYISTNYNNDIKEVCSEDITEIQKDINNLSTREITELLKDNLDKIEIKEWTPVRKIIEKFLDKNNIDKNSSSIYTMLMKDYKNEEMFVFNKNIAGTSLIISKEYHKELSPNNVLYKEISLIENKEVTLSKEFISTFFDNLEEGQKYILENLLIEKITMKYKMRNIYKEFEQRFIDLKKTMEHQIMLSKKINKELV